MSKVIPLAHTDKGVITITKIEKPYGEKSSPVVSIGISLNGDAQNPSYSWSSDTDTGFYHTGTQGKIAYSSNGSKSFDIDSSYLNLYGDSDKINEALSDV